MTIKEVSEKYSLSEDTLRYYEKSGLIGPVKRQGGKRNYTIEDEKRIEFVKCMRSAEIPISVLSHYISLYDKGDSTYNERLELLKTEEVILEEKINTLSKSLDILKYKIKLYEENKLDEYLKGEDL